MLWTLIGCVFLAVVISLGHNNISNWWKWYFTSSEDGLALEHFHRSFDNFTRDFKEEIHPDSMKTLRQALEHHVHIASDVKNSYPTCVLVAGDQASTKTLTCLADRIAAMVPSTRKDIPADKHIHVVNLSDDSHHPEKPDDEDLRSRVHHGINKGMDAGAKIIIFRNLESLIPLLQLFYSYCDGENPTFPKTLWILTMGTKDVSFLDGSNVDHQHKDFAKNANRKVELFLESILDSASPDQAAKSLKKKETTGRNPLLTRIANYIVPVLRHSEPGGRCVANPTA